MNCCAKPKRETGTHGAPPTFDADTVRVLDLASKTWTDEEAEGLAGLKGQPETVRKVMATDNAAVRDIMYVTSPGPLNPFGARPPPPRIASMHARNLSVAAMHILTCMRCALKTLS